MAVGSSVVATGVAVAATVGAGGVLVALGCGTVVADGIGMVAVGALIGCVPQLASASISAALASSIRLYAMDVNRRIIGSFLGTLP